MDYAIENDSLNSYMKAILTRKNERTCIAIQQQVRNPCPNHHTGGERFIQTVKYTLARVYFFYGKKTGIKQGTRVPFELKIQKYNNIACMVNLWYNTWKNKKFMFAIYKAKKVFLKRQ